jgi:hypothetical protein
LNILCLGFGIFTIEALSAGDFVVEYAGKLLKVAEADKLQDQTYVYYFQNGGMEYR